MFPGPYDTKTEKDEAYCYFPKMILLPSQGLFKYLRQNRLNRDRPVVSNKRESRSLWHLGNIGQSPTYPKTSPSNQVLKNYSQLRCQLQSYLLVSKGKHTIGIVSNIRIHIRKQTANKARSEGHRTQYR